MKTITIRHYESFQIIYQCKINDIKQCLEKAIQENIDLDGADLRNKDLRNINLDGTSLKNIQFQNCDLTGANISEATLDHCNFSYAKLIDCCLYETEIKHCHFKETFFAATDITMASFHNCNFSGTNFKSLNFTDHTRITECHYLSEDNYLCSINKAPMNITGFGSPILITDEHIITREQTYDFFSWKNALTQKHYQSMNIPSSLIWHLIDIRQNPTRQTGTA